MNGTKDCENKADALQLAHLFTKEHTKECLRGLLAQLPRHHNDARYKGVQAHFAARGRIFSLFYPSELLRCALC